MRPKEFLEEHSRELKERESFYLFRENNGDDTRLWNTAKMRVLVIFLSPLSTRAVANTHSALIGVLKADLGTDIFVDFSFFPNESDFNLMRESNCSIIFGQSTHRTPEEFDIICLSNTIVEERLNLVSAFLYSGIPLGHHERNKKKFPIILQGGLSAFYGETMYGRFKDPVSGNEDECLVDLTFFGEAEYKMALVLKAISDTKNKGGDRMAQIRAAQESVDCVMFPLGYDIKYDDKKERILSNKRRYDWMPPFIYPNYPDNPDFEKYNFDRKILNLNGDNVRSGELNISMGCIGGYGACNFCSEGSVSGKWREIAVPVVQTVIRRCIKQTAAVAISFFSFNINLHSRFKRLIYEVAARVPQLKIINNRADIIGADSEIVPMFKVLGVGKSSTALEGLGPRIRNGLYNKNLSTEHFIKAMTHMIQNRMLEFKLGGIISGYEQKRDVDLGVAELAEVIKIRDSYGSKASVRINWTPLVHYEHTPLQWMERRTSKNCLSGEKTMGHFLEKARELGIRSKFNGKGYGTAIQQLYLDGGRKYTETMVEFAIKHDKRWYGSCGIKKWQPLVDMVRERFNLDIILGERPKDWIYPNHRIQAGNEGAVIQKELELKSIMDPVTRELTGWEASEDANYCMNSKANKHPVCNTTTMRRKFESQAKRGDVDLTEGKVPLYGISDWKAFEKSNAEYGRPEFKNNAALYYANHDILLYHGCSNCSTGQEIANKLKAVLDDSVDRDKIREIKAETNRIEQRLKIKVFKNPKYDFIAGTSLAAMTMTRLFKANDSLVDAYHSYGKSSTFWSEKGEAKVWHDGQVIFDLKMKKAQSLDELREYIQIANRGLHLFKIADVYESFDGQDEISHTDLGFYTFNSSIPFNNMTKKAALWRQTVKECTPPMQGPVQSKIDERLLAPLFIPGGKGTVGVIGLLIKYNPFQLLSEFNNISLHNITAKTEMKMVLHAYEGLKLCKESGRAGALIDRFDNHQLPVAKEIYMRKLLGKIKTVYMNGQSKEVRERELVAME